MCVYSAFVNFDKEVFLMQFLYLFIAIPVLVIAFLLLLAFAVEKVAFGNRCEGNAYLQYFTAADFPNLTADPVAFTGNCGQVLRGNLYTQAGRQDFKALLVFSHGMGGGHLSYTTELDFFAKRGYLVLAYDNTGTMASEGKSLVGMPQAVSDLRSALAFAKQDVRTKDLPVVLAGHSWGGYTVCRVLYFHPQVKGAVAFSAPDDVPRLLCAQAKAMTGKNLGFLEPFLRLYERLRFGKATAMRTSEIAAQTDVPLLLLHGGRDTTVRPEDAAATQDVLKNRKNIQTVLYPEKQHNVYATVEAEQYIADAFSKLGVLTKDKAKAAEAKAFAATLDFRKMCEEDTEVMETVVAFLDGCL